MTAIPSTTWRSLAQRGTQPPLPEGLDALWDRASGLIGRIVPRRRRCLSRASRVLAMDKEFADLTDAKLRERALEFLETFRIGHDTKRDLLRAAALVREVAARKLGMKMYRVQLASGFALLDGCIAEMATGEGKTLSATVPAVVAGWRGKGCHVLTTNDYLAQRDAEEMKPVYEFCGLSVAAVIQEMPPPQRKAGYDADITYLTNKEAAADFLRDRLALGRLQGVSNAIVGRVVHEGRGSGADRLVQRGLAFAIVDEADSVLIDEAVTPLIISGEAPNPEQVESFHQAQKIADELEEGKHYRVNPRYREVDLTPAGIDRAMELGEAHGGLWAGRRRAEEMVVQALTSRHFFLRDKQYVIQEDKVVIVDESTGRLMPDREWRDGLHQAVSAKEGVEIQAPKDTYARISFQRFFRGYRHLCGMTGTAAEATPEFWQIFHLPVVLIPTNRPCIRTQAPDRVFDVADARWAAVVEEIAASHAAGRPVLVGTRSVRSSEHLSRLLTEAGLEDHQVLNAVRHKEEAQIIAQAGQVGKITVATNMAGRGVDIKLGRGVTELGGLHVIAPERNQSRRVDRQLFGRAGRQGDPGSAQVYVSLDDELLEQFTPTLSKLLRRRYGHGGREASNRLTRWAFNVAQRRSQRQALRQRKQVLRTDDWLDEYLGFAGRES